jgi:protein SCO1/2
MIWGGGFLGLLVVAVLAFAIFEPIQVLPRIRLAPGYALTNQTGERVTSEDHRGSVTLYTFTYTDCPGDCFGIDDTMREVRDRVSAEIDLDGVEFKLVTISIDAERDTPERLAAAAAGVDANPGEWEWLTGSQQMIRNVVGGGFKTWFEIDGDEITFDPAFVVVDGNGIVRGEYRYQTLASDPDRITRHIGVLAEEIRNAHGGAAIAYEAAHLFLCYP